VPSDHDETGAVSSSSSARPVSDVGCFLLIRKCCPHQISSQLYVTFETIRQKDGAADGDEESEEDEFHDVSLVLLHSFESGSMGPDCTKHCAHFSMHSSRLELQNLLSL
jgi:hypothetical protein